LETIADAFGTKRARRMLPTRRHRRNAVVGRDYKRDFAILNQSLDSDRYPQNLEDIGFIDSLDQSSGPELDLPADWKPAQTSRFSMEWAESRVGVVVD
jgi:hypothetical protein